MKKISLILCGIAAVLLMSCGKEKKVEFPLAGEELTFTTLESEIVDYTGILDPAIITFNEDGTYAGTLGCNEVNGQFTFAETEFKINGVNSTKMACSEEGNAYEARVKSILERVNAYEVNNGKLILKEGDKTLAIAEKGITIEKVVVDTVVEEAPVVEEEKPAAKPAAKKPATQSNRPTTSVKLGDNSGEKVTVSTGQTNVTIKQGEVNAATSSGTKVTVTAGGKKAAIQARQQEEANK